MEEKRKRLGHNNRVEYCMWKEYFSYRGTYSY